MKTNSLVIGIVMGIAFAACSPSVKVPEPVEGPSLELSSIDSLMWRQPDSALAQLQRFAISPAADSLDEFNGHYCQLLVSELLYKNYKPQSNRDELLQAVDYFDSIVAADEADTHKADKRGASLRERNVFLDARAHYINGAGYYERGEVVNGCAEYLKALEVMEEQFEEKALTGKKAVFMFYIYNRLLELFSAQFMIDPALACGEKALEICLNDPSLSKEIPNLYSHIGKQYEKKGEKEIARNYYGLAIEGLSDANSLVYRDAVSIKALSDYNVGLGADSSLTAIKQVLAQANTEKERLTRFLTIGVIFTAERFFDSALYYLEPVFENEDNVSLQMQAAEYLIVSYNNLGNKEKADECILFLSNYKKTDGENKALVSKLEDLYKDYSNQKKEKESEEAREKSIKETVEIIVPIAIMVALAVFIVVKLRSKKQLKQQHEKADKALEEKEQEHEETLKRLQAESEQHLAEAEKKHQQWMADAEERHSEELRTQKDRADKEMEKTKKRHNEELEAVRQTHQMQQAALSGRLKRSNEELRDISKRLELSLSKNAQYESGVSNDYAAFINDPICKHIVGVAHKQQFKSKTDYLIYKDNALSKEQLLDLRNAVQKHLPRFVSHIRRQYPKLTDNDMDCCCLVLLGLNEADISAMMQRAYTTVCDRSRKISRIIGTNDSLYYTLRNMLDE